MATQKMRNILLLGGLLALSQTALAQVGGAGGAPGTPVQAKVQPSPALRAPAKKADEVKKAPAAKKQSRRSPTTR